MKANDIITLIILSTLPIEVFIVLFVLCFYSEIKISIKSVTK